MRPAESEIGGEKRRADESRSLNVRQHVINRVNAGDVRVMERKQSYLAVFVVILENIYMIPHVHIN